MNLFCPEADMRPLSHMYRAAWRKGLKTTYYLRSRSASNIEKSSVAVEEVQLRGVVGQTAPTVEEYAAFVADARRKAEAGEACESCQ